MSTTVNHVTRGEVETMSRMVSAATMSPAFISLAMAATTLDMVSNGAEPLVDALQAQNDAASAENQELKMGVVQGDFSVPDNNVGVAKAQAQAQMIAMITQIRSSEISQLANMLKQTANGNNIGYMFGVSAIQNFKSYAKVK